MGTMKRLFILSVAFACSIGAVVSTAEAQGAAATPVQSTEARLATVLQTMVRNNSDDFYDAAALVYDASGNMLSFVSMMTAAAEQGNPAALLWQARYLRMTAATEPAGISRARTLLEQAAKKKYVPAMVEYAAMVYEQASSEQEARPGRQMLMEACRAGSAKARALYLMVSGRMQNSSLTAPEVASELRRKNFYLEELIAAAQQEPSSFVMWMERASEHGSPFAPYALCSYVAADKADACLKLAVDRHLPAALGHMGTGIVRTEAARMEQYDAQKAAEGLRMLHIAAMLCEPAAVSSLASFLAEGYGATMNKELVYGLFHLAHRSGDPNGTAGLGYCMVLGAGCSQDVPKGLEYLATARTKGSQWVNQALASIYYNGDGVPADLNKAINALTEDYANGSRHAYVVMAAITAMGNSSTAGDERRARLFLNMAISDGNLQAEPFYDFIVQRGKWRFLEELAE